MLKLMSPLRWDGHVAMTERYRPAFQQRLAEIDGRITHGERQIAEQHKRIAELDADKHETAHAKSCWPD